MGCQTTTDALMSLCVQAATAFEPSPFLGALARLDITDAQRREIMSAARYAHRHEVLYPGAREVLVALSRRYRLGVVANQSEGTEKRLQRWSIRKQFKLVLASAELGLWKPDPAVFQRCLHQAGCSPREAVMVGDRLDNDVGPAKREGWWAIRVLQGFSRFQKPRDRYEKPDMTVASIADLIGILMREPHEVR
jgi:HAD superfamily hydrolase (TIGR01549 family)